jgi:hypothetical protein
MRKIIDQAVVTLDGQVSTPQTWLPTRWAGEFEQLSKDLLFSVDALLYGRVSYENHADARAEGTAGRRRPQDRHRRLVQADAARAPTGRRIPVLAVPGHRRQRRRLYDGIDTTDLDLIDVKQLDNGILGLTYVPTTTR